MKLCNKKAVFKIITISLSIIVLSACNIDFDKDINAAEKNRSSLINFVNATDEMTNFYVSINAISESIYNSKYIFFDTFFKNAHFKSLLTILKKSDTY